MAVHSISEFLGSSSGSWCSSQHLPATADSGMQQMVLQVIGSLTIPVGDSAWAPDSGFQSHLLWAFSGHLESKTVVFLLQTNKYILKGYLYLGRKKILDFMHFFSCNMHFPWIFGRSLRAEARDSKKFFFYTKRSLSFDSTVFEPFKVPVHACMCVCYYLCVYYIAL